MLELAKSDIKVKVPKAICLISKYPVFKQMKVTLNGLLKAAHFHGTDSLKSFLPYIILEIPKPIPNFTIAAQIYKKAFIEVSGPCDS